MASAADITVRWIVGPLVWVIFIPQAVVAKLSASCNRTSDLLLCLGRVPAGKVVKVSIFVLNVISLGCCKDSICAIFFQVLV